MVKKSNKWSLYKADGEKTERLRKSCPRCGDGVFLAQHNDRATCGKCGYTEFLKKEDLKAQTSKQEVPVEQNPKKGDAEQSSTDAEAPPQQEPREQDA